MAAPNMSEKHGHLSGAQWTAKTPAAAAGGTAATSLQKNQQPNPIYEATSAVATSPYGIPGVSVPIPEIPSYTSGRFQAPPLHLHPTKSSPLTIAPIVAPPQPQMLLQSQVSPTPTNVPVPSGGFVPPVFPNMTAPGASASGTTPVLTPNPFATSSGNPGLAFVNAFNLSSAHQLELGKIMHAMNSNVNATATTPSTPGTPAAAATGLQRHPQPTHPPHPSESGAVVVPAAAVSGAINSTIAENVMSALSSDEDRMRRVQQVIEASLE